MMRKCHCFSVFVFFFGQDSSTCAAAIHAGVVLNEQGGDCTLLKTEGRDFYAGSTRHGITTRQ